MEILRRITLKDVLAQGGSLVDSGLNYQTGHIKSGIIFQRPNTLRCTICKKEGVVAGLFDNQRDEREAIITLFCSQHEPEKLRIRRTVGSG